MDTPTILNNTIEKKIKIKRNTQAKHGPQQCQVCGKVFGNASALAKHKLTHSNERKYVCTTCTKAFKRQDHLNGHLLTHRNKKPFECDQPGCGKSYCDARSLRRHIENHHKCGVNSGTKSTITPSNDSQVHQFENVHVKNLEIRPRTWNIQMKLQNSTPYDSAHTEVLQLNENSTQKLVVECHLCHRNFKNIPALNGHMRLHGGYLKKDLDKVKVKKEKVPHLITASVGVRALIGEKIFNKRNIEQILVAPSLSTSFKRRNISPETQIPIECLNDNKQSNNLVDTTKHEVLIPLQLHGKKQISEKPSPILVKTQLGNLNPKINKSIRQFMYSLDTVNTSTDMNDLKKIINLQVVQKDLVGINKDFLKYNISNLSTFKTVQNYINDTSLKRDEREYTVNNGKTDQSFIFLSSENLNNMKSSKVVINDPLLSATSKEVESKRASLTNNLKSNYEKKIALNSKAEEQNTALPYYRPYPMFAKKSKLLNQSPYLKAKINIGMMYQANIPELAINTFENINDNQNCLWNPKLLPNDHSVEKYCSLLKTKIFSSLIKNEEEGLKVLYDANGKVHVAITNFLKAQNNSESQDHWTKHEFEYFYYFLQNKGKKFDIMSKNIGTKSTFQCIQMYYLLKKNVLKK